MPTNPTPAIFGLPRLSTFPGFSVDKPPTAPHPKNDEFIGSALAAKWTNPTTSAVGACRTVVSGGTLKLTTPSSGIHAAGIRQAAPTGSFTIYGSIYYADSYTFDIRCGLFVGINGGKGHVCGPLLQEGTAGVIGVTTASNTSDWSGYDGYLTGSATAGGWGGYYAIQWVAGTSTLHFMSWRGVALGWVDFTTRGSMSQPDQIGVMVYGNGAFGAATPAISVNWFRVTEP